MEVAYSRGRALSCALTCLLIAYSACTCRTNARIVAETIPGTFENAEHAKIISSTVEAYSHGREMLMASALSKSCTASHASRKLLHQRGAARRLQELEDIRSAKSIRIDVGSSAFGSSFDRSLLSAEKALAANHKHDLTDLPDDPSELFSNNVSCLLMPPSIEGPFWIDGQPERSDIVDGQGGIDLFVHMQFVDVNTCQPVEGLLIDVWHANATGVYSGIVDPLSLPQRDPQIEGTNFHRGATTTDADGIASFTTKYPGHYPGRCKHIHMIVSKPEASTSASSSSKKYSPIAIGQLYFDSALNEAVKLKKPYSTNNMPFTTCAEDSVFPTSSKSDFDPIFNYGLLGTNLSDGVFGWMNIGVDLEGGLDREVLSAGSVGGPIEAVSSEAQAPLVAALGIDFPPDLLDPSGAEVPE